MKLSESVQKKLGHNFHELSDLEKVYYQLVVRPKLSAEYRFFFEGVRQLVGQMYLAERQALFTTLLQHKPQRCFEIGTFTGGGSTFFLASAFRKIGTGRLLSLEVSPMLHSLAKAAYQAWLPHLLPHVTFLLGGDVTLFSPYIPAGEGVSALFLDGAENADVTLDQYRFFQPHMRPGSILMAHDWRTDKMAAVRPIIESDPRWETLLALDPPYSVGFVVCRRC